MALTIEQFSKAIRASTGAPTGAVLDDVTRLHTGIVAMVDRYAMAAPVSIKELAIVQIGQYLYDSPVASRRFTSSALRESGASALLAPYRTHRLGIEDAVVAAAAAAGIDRDAVIAIIRELVSDWAFIGSQTAIPGEGAGFDQGAVDNRIGALVWDWAQAADNGPIDTVGKITEPMIFGFVKNILLEGQGIDITDVDVTSRITIAATGAAPGNGGGLDQAAVDARINALIPALRRMIDPTGFTSSDDGTFAVWDDANNDWENGSFTDLNGFTWTFDTADHTWKLNSDKLNQAEVDARADIRIGASDKLNQAAVDARVTALVPSWARMAQRFTDEQDEVFNAFTGDRWIDDANYQVSQVSFSNQISARAASLQTTQFGAKYSVGTRQRNIWLIGRTPRNDTDTYRLNIIDYGTVTHTGATISSGNFRYSFFELVDKPAGDDVKVEKYNKIVLDYSKFENVERAAVWAREGDTSPIPHDKVSVLEQYITERMDTDVGIAITSTDQAKRSVAAEFTQTLTLEANQHGLLLVGIRWHEVAPTLALGDAGLSVERNIAFHEIAALATYSASTTNGIKIGSVDVHTFPGVGPRSAKRAGELTFYIGKNADGDVLYFFDYQPDDDFTGTAGSGSIQVRAEVYSLPSGAPTDTDTDTFLGLSDTPTSFTGQAGKVAKVNSGEDAIVFEDETASSGGGGETVTLIATIPSSGEATIGGASLLGLSSHNFTQADLVSAFTDSSVKAIDVELTTFTRTFHRTRLYKGSNESNQRVRGMIMADRKIFEVGLANEAPNAQVYFRNLVSAGTITARIRIYKVT